MEHGNNLLLQIILRPQMAVRPKVGGRDERDRETQSREGVGGVLTKRVVVVVQQTSRNDSPKPQILSWTLVTDNDDEVGDEEERESNPHSPNLTSEQSRFAEAVIT